MSYIAKLLAFVLFTIVFWFVVLMTVGMIAYASVCHYPEFPGCETDLTLFWTILIAALGLYGGAFYGFRRWTKQDRSGYR